MVEYIKWKEIGKSHRSIKEGLLGAGCLLLFFLSVVRVP